MNSPSSVREMKEISKLLIVNSPISTEAVYKTNLQQGPYPIKQ